MIKKANEYDDDHKKTYLDAAARFRLPYWDLAMPRNDDDSKATEKAKKLGVWRWGLPEILKRTEVYVRRPDKPDELHPMDNPLYSFNFPKEEEYAGVKNRPQIPWKQTGIGWRFGDDKKPIFRDDNSVQFKHTVRGPTTRTKADTDEVYLDEAVQLQTRALTTYVWQMLNPEEELDVSGTGAKIKVNEWRPWNYFANHTRVPEDTAWKIRAIRSIESWHDNIHNLIGTGKNYTGHMGDPSIAAFDPLFWLHHNNIERLFCVYQVLYPDKFVSPGKRQDQNPPVPRNDPNWFADDELYPFTKDSKTKKCYTSTDVQEWTKSGFAVPGDQDLGEVGQKAVAQYLRDTYYW